MFYSAQILAKKGSLATIWIAAHLDRRLNRDHVFSTSIPNSVDTIVDPDQPLALRLSGQLLLGVVKIYSKKVNYLFEDCSSAIIKIQEVVQPADLKLLREGTAKHAEHTITLPKDLDELDIFGTRPFELRDIAPYQPSAVFSLGGQDTFTLTDEGSSQFEAKLSMSEEQFPAMDDDMELMLQPPEQLREAAPAPLSGRKHYEELGIPTPEPSGTGQQEDALFEVPDQVQDLPPAPPASPPRAPSSQHSETSQASLEGLEQLGGALELPDVQGGLDDLLPTPSDGPTQEEESSQKATRKGKSPQGPAGQRMKKPRLDVENGMVATQLQGAAIRALLANPAPLLRQRGPLMALQHADEVQLAAQEDDTAAGEDGPLLPPPEDARAMAPALRQAFQGPVRGPKRTPRGRGRGKKDAPSPVQPHSLGRTLAADEAGAEMDVVAGARMPDGEPLPALDFVPEADGDAMADAVPLPDESGAGHLELDGAADHAQALQLEPDEVPLEDVGLADETVPSHSDRRDGHAPTLSEPSMGGSVRENEGTSAQTSFTNRTRTVLEHLQVTWEGGLGTSKRRRKTGAGTAVALASVGLNTMLTGKSRQDASRWFFELLVLKSQGFVELQQAQPYAEISVSAARQLGAVHA